MSSTQTISKQNESLDLSPILSKLSANVTKSMASLFDLQRAIVYEIGNDPFVSEVQDLRRLLKQDWEKIAAFLKQASHFAKDIIHLRSIVSTASKAELDGFFLDLIRTSNDVVTKCRALTANRLSPTLPYDANWGSPSHRPDFRFQSESSKGNVTSEGYRNWREFHDATHAVETALLDMLGFWSSCDQYLQGFGGRVTLTKWDALEMTKRWPEYQEQIRGASSTIREACDAIMIEAAGTPSPQSSRRTERYSSLSVTSQVLPVVLSVAAGLVALEGPKVMEWLMAPPGPVAASIPIMPDFKRVEPSGTMPWQCPPSKSLPFRGPMSSEPEPIHAGPQLFRLGQLFYRIL